MSDERDEGPEPDISVSSAVPSANPPITKEREDAMRMFGMRLNWKVLAGLAIVALGIWALAPNVFGAAGPVLLALACPLSMVFMMQGMRSGQGRQSARGMERMPDKTDVMQPEQSVRGEARLEPPARPGRETGARELTREEHVALLREELAGVRARQAAIARELDALDGAAAAPDHRQAALREAEAIAGRLAKNGRG